MLNKQREENLKSVVLKGLCPNCRSSQITYHEYERNQKFFFRCSKCGWQSLYDSEEFKEASSYWCENTYLA